VPEIITILIIDDEDAIRRSFARVIRRKYRDKVTILETSNAAKGLRTISEKVSLIITDCDMPPGMSGIDLIRLLHQQGSTIPTLLLSGKPKNIVPAITAGATAAFTKPITTRELLNIIARLLN